MVKRKLQSKIRKRFEQLSKDIILEGYQKEEVEILLKDLKNSLLKELDEFEKEVAQVEDED